ncbi:MAG: YdcF family protein [Ancrocorticia sp.]
MEPVHIILGMGLVLLAVGVVRFIRERRRISNVIFLLFGAALTLFAALILSSEANGPTPWVLLPLAIMVAAPFLGYPVLTIFLLINGVMMVRREQRSLGNLLSLILGIGFAVLPFALPLVTGLLERVADEGYVSPDLVSGFFAYAFGVAMYVAFCFFVYLSASFLYRKVPGGLTADYVVVLGSGLIGTRVPPLLAARLDKGIEVANAQNPPATIIPSGGQGPDEEISEAEGMARYLREHGIPQERIILEDQARNTRENLLFSQKLLPTPDTKILVTTNSYHVFRSAMLTRELGLNAHVVGSKTARYFVPSAFLREFAAVMKQYLRLNAIFIGLWTLMFVALTVLGMLLPN